MALNWAGEWFPNHRPPISLSLKSGSMSDRPDTNLCQFPWNHVSAYYVDVKFPILRGQKEAVTPSFLVGLNPRGWGTSWRSQISFPSPISYKLFFMKRNPRTSRTSRTSNINNWCAQAQLKANFGKTVEPWEWIATRNACIVSFDLVIKQR